MNALNPVRPLGDQVAEAIRIHDPSIGRREASRRSDELLARVGIVREQGASTTHTPARAACVSAR